MAWLQMHWAGPAGLFDARVLAIAFACATVLSVIAIVVRALGAYRRVTMARLSTGLRQSFSLARPHAMLAAGLVLTCACAAIALVAYGPAAAIACGILGLSAPSLALRRLAHRRRRDFVQQLPDALLALSSALRAGANLTRGLELLATRQPPPLGQEFALALAEHRLGHPLSESLAQMRRRLEAPELDLVNAAMSLARRVGGNLAETLETLARSLQEQAQLRGKIEALTAMGRAQGWVVGLLPLFIGLVLFQQQPERMRLLFTQWYGWLVLAVVAAMMALAAWMIRRIVRIDV